MGRSSGKKRAAVLGFLGLRDEQASAWQRSQQHLQQRHGGTAAASDAPLARAAPPTSSCYGGGSDDDVDRRASEFIDRVHRRMLGGDAAPWPESS
ncbi:unnamed protein product [Urochloa decumbens]|uniref:Uncharacterized protein n=1 Tax=Urochloa decumbens TaxID=240449 RepID=A0ABC8WIV1_9POAL